MWNLRGGFNDESLVSEIRFLVGTEECEKHSILCSFEGAEAQAPQPNISGDNSLRVPPVPIPNTEVKPQHADSTWLETAREGRSSPDSTETFVRMSLFLCFFLLYEFLLCRSGQVPCVSITRSVRLYL